MASMLSIPLDRALGIAGIAPQRLDRALDERIRSRITQKEVDHISRLITRATGLVVTRLARRNRYILMEAGDARFRYREHGRDQADVFMAGRLPAITQSAAVGQSLGSLVNLADLAPLFGDSIISGFPDSIEGWLTIDLKPNWLTSVSMGSAE